MRKIVVNPVSMNDSLFGYCEIVDWWGAERLAASQACFALQETLFERAKEETANVSYQHLLIEDSDERK
ncbi:MAG: hypothetical protein ACK4SS_06320, partial [Cypionkella sp.]